MNHNRKVFVVLFILCVAVNILAVIIINGYRKDKYMNVDEKKL